MRRLLMVVVLGGILLGSFCLAHAMRKLPNAPGGTSLAKRGASPSLSAADMAALKRRIVTAKGAMDRFHVVGSKSSPVPPAALDALADWRDNSAPDVEVWWDPDWQTPFFIKGHDLALLPKVPLAKYGHNAQLGAAMSTFSALAGFLSLRDCENELRVLSQNTDHLGLTHVRLQQTYRGHDVWARDLYAHFTADGHMNLINGRWVPTPKQLDGIDPIIAADAAAKSAAAHFAGREHVGTLESELVVYVDTAQAPHWAWMVRTSLGLTEGYDVFIDAVNSEYLHQVSYVYSDGPVVGSGVDLFGDTRPVYAYQVGSWYYMINTTKPMYDVSYTDFDKGCIRVWNYDAAGWPLVKSSNRTSWNNPAAVSAAHYFALIFDYYWSTHARSSFNAANATIDCIVNHSIGGNAYWNGQLVVVGIGDFKYANWAGALDLMGHELAHGVTQFTAGLKYENQSGALNESFSDIFGTLIEFYGDPAYADWKIGEDIHSPTIPGGVLRDMQNPANGDPPQPTKMSEYLQMPNTEAGDQGGVHYNSGIPNRAFYIITSSIGRNKADSIFYRTLTTGKLSTYAQFVDLRRGVLQSAAELYPGNTTIADAIASAFNTVEISDGTGTPPPGAEPIPTSEQWIVAIDVLTLRVARLDTTGKFVNYVSTGQAIKKPSVPDSADVVYFIDDSYNLRMVGPDGSGEVVITLPGVSFANIGVSPDGEKLAFDLEWKDTLFILDLVGDDDKVLPLYTPSYDAGSEIHNVLYPDVIEWDIYGKKILYDCWNYLPRETDTLYYWDIHQIDPETGVIQRPLPLIPVGITIGNPTFAKTRPNIMAFDAELAPGTFFVVGADLTKNKMDIITNNYSHWGFPSFAPDDKRLVYQYAADLWRANLDSTSIKGLGNDRRIALLAFYANWRFEGRDKIPTGIFEDDQTVSVPSAFALHQNYPNPFNASTVIEFTLDRSGPVMLEVFNILGQRVAKLRDEPLAAGVHRVEWDGKDENGRQAASGVYFYRLVAGDQVSTKRMVLLK